MSFNSILSSVSYTLGNSRANWEEQKDAIRKLRVSSLSQGITIRDCVLGIEICLKQIILILI